MSFHVRLISLFFSTASVVLCSRRPFVGGVEKRGQGALCRQGLAPCAPQCDALLERALDPVEAWRAPRLPALELVEGGDLLPRPPNRCRELQDLACDVPRRPAEQQRRLIEKQGIAFSTCRARPSGQRRLARRANEGVAHWGTVTGSLRIIFSIMLTNSVGMQPKQGTPPSFEQMRDEDEPRALGPISAFLLGPPARSNASFRQPKGVLVHASGLATARRAGKGCLVR